MQDPSFSHDSPAPAHHELTPSAASTIPSFICKHAKPSWGSSPELGKASDACMPFVPVSMEATTLLLLCPTFFPSCPSPSLFLRFLLLSSLYIFTRGGIICARDQSILYNTSLPRHHPNSPHRYHNHKSHATLAPHSLLLETFLCAQKYQHQQQAAVSSSSSNGIQRLRPRARSSRHSCHR